MNSFIRMKRQIWYFVLDIETFFFVGLIMFSVKISVQKYDWLVAKFQEFDAFHVNYDLKDIFIFISQRSNSQWVVIESNAS